MKIQVVGMDPSMNHWGMCKGYLDLSDGTLDIVAFKLIEPEIVKTKTVRKNSLDTDRATELFKSLKDFITGSILIFTETPVGSQSSRSQTSYGMCVGLTGALRACGYTIIQIDASSSKLALTGNKTASKKEMIESAVSIYPTAPWLRQGKRVLSKCEHLADAIGSIHAGVLTPEFNNYLAAYKSLGNDHAN